MKRKSSFLLVFALAISSIFSDCKVTRSRPIISDIEFKNETSDTFTLHFYRSQFERMNFTILPKTSKVFVEEGEDSPVVPMQFLNSDSAVVTLNQDKQILYAWYRPSLTEKDLLHYSGFEETKENDQKYYYVYRFTNEHVTKAK